MNRFLAIFGACSAIPCIVVLLFFVAPLAAGAQSAGKLHRIGFLGNSTATLEANLVGPFRESLRELGHVEGQNIVIEYRWAEGKYERFPALIAELLAQRVEVIVTAGTPASLAVQKATTSVPLVMVGVGDPVTTGLVASLARPGGTITGVTSNPEGLEGKRLAALATYREGLRRFADSVEINKAAGRLATALQQSGDLAAAKRHALLALEETPRFRAAQRRLLEIVRQIERRAAKSGTSDQDAAGEIP